MKTILRKILTFLVMAVVFGYIYAWASPWAYPEKRVGFAYGMGHGFLMPIALPSLVLGKDVPIYAADNTGRFYKIGYICGINVCGIVFFGPIFWRPRQPEIKKTDSPGTGTK